MMLRRRREKTAKRRIWKKAECYIERRVEVSGK